MNCLYTIPLCNFGFAFRHATSVISKDFGKALLKTKSSPIFFSYKLSEQKPLLEIAHCIIETRNNNTVAEFRSVVKDTKSNTKNITKSISIHSDY